MSVPGRRVPDDTAPGLYAPGDYGRFADAWWCRPPVDVELVGNLARHDVTEHEDGSITVSPSILIRRGPGGPSWHGYLEAGAWREC